MSVQDQLKKIKGTIPPNVTLVAVSKTKPIEAVLEAYEAGQRDFGENYVQELISKQEVLPKDIRWHFIGHLQSNKVKMIAPFVHLIHGVDSVKLLEEINKQGAKLNRVVPCLLQIHIAKEESKFGFSYEECGEFISSGKLDSMKFVQVQGLMGMGTNTGELALLKKEYSELHTFYQKMREMQPAWTILSCGMSGDYLLAIEQGSNMVRIGSSIFGEREYQHKV
ncbi:MAG: YggS family pyridoxal phosphate-dependent enzyme [Bacteroidia bacterium]|nr:YggS family pyridoxal phosphate-dependent enzyme [Bacteroidia bacterium]